MTTSTELQARISERQLTQSELAAYHDQLEELVEARTRRLEVVAMLSGRFNSILDFDQLLIELVNQVQQNFGYYHTHVFILDEAEQKLVVHAGVGEAGAKMKAAGHHLMLQAPTGLVPRAARERQAVLAVDVWQDPTWLSNPLLPETRCEMAVPIIGDERVFGVLDVQSAEVGGLDEGDASLLQSLANQVAVALTNAELFAQAQAQQAALRQEIARREQVEQDLRTYKTLVENAPDGIYVTTLSGKITYANPAFCQLMGYGQEIVGMNAAEFLPDDALTQFGGARQAILEGVPWQGYLPHRCADGRIVPIRASSFMIWDEHGQPTALASINHDITKQQQAEQALLASEKKFYSLYISMNEALALYELIYNEAGRPIDYRFMDVNPTFTTMTGLKWEDVVGQKASEVYKMERLPYLGTYNWVAESGETTSFEARLDHVISTVVPEPTPKIIRIAAFSPMRGQFATILQDITQRKQIEQRMANYNRTLEEDVAERTSKLTQTLENLKATQSQLVESEKMAALGSLVAGVAHEINTPVGIGVSMASFLAHETQKINEMVKTGKMKISALKDYLQSASESSALILNNLNRAAELVQSFKQVAVDQTSLDKRPFNVKPYIEEILLNLRHVLKRTDHVIEVHGDNAATLNSYPGAFSQVVSNLVMNSLKHAYEEGDTGLMRFDIAQHGEVVTVTYKDDGIGIPPENLGRIFEPFFTTARSRGGSGLGLHIVYNLVTQTLQGMIHCQSEIGQGTQFVIELPTSLSN